MAVVNPPTVNVGVHIFPQDSGFSSFGKISTNGFLSLIQFLIFLRLLHNVSHARYTVLLSHQQFKWVPVFPHPYKYLSLFFSNSHPDRYEVKAHYDSDLHFPLIIDVEQFFIHLLAIHMLTSSRNAYLSY